MIQGKYQDNAFSEELVEASAELLGDFIKEHEIQWITSIPSIRRPALVLEFSCRLAERLHLPYAAINCEKMEAEKYFRLHWLIVQAGREMNK